MAKSKAPGPSKVPAQSSSDSVSGDAFKELSGERRIKDLASAQAIYTRLQTDNTLRSATFARVRNQLEGGRPFNPDDLEAQGAAWQTNVNFGDSEAARDRTLLPYWKMVNDVPHRIAVKVMTTSPHADQFSMAFAQCFDDFLDDWGAGYFTEFMNTCQNYVNFGPGIVHWGDKDSPRYKAANVTRVLWPKNARMSPDEWEVMAMVQDTSPSDLYKRIRTKKDRDRSTFAGWSVDQIKATIVAFRDGNTQDPYDYTRWQDNLVNNDLAVSTPFEPIPVVWLFVKQFDGKIGCYVFTQQSAQNGTPGMNVPKASFMFESHEYADSFREILGALWYNTGTDSMVHSIKGFAVKNYFFSALQNRTKSRMIDGGTMSMGLNFQRSNENVPDEAPPVENYGPITIFPPGMQQLANYPTYQAGAGLLAMLENNAATNNSLYREQQQQIEQTDTATQAKILAAMQSETSAATASIYLSQMGENIFSEQMRRLRRKGNTDADAKEFVKRMKEMNVPDEVIHDTKIRVRTGANAGLANPAMRAMKFQQGMALRNMPGVNVRWFLENYIATEYGADAVNHALLPEGEQGDPYNVRQAKMENNDFGSGSPLDAIPTDDHAVHLQQHLGPAGQIAQQYTQTGEISPEQVSALAITMEHSAQHMQFLSQDDTQKAQFAEIRPIFTQLKAITTGIMIEAQKKQQQQQMQQGQPQQQLTG